MKGESKSKKVTCKKNFYFTILNELKTTKNLTKIQKKLNISKQNLNYYLRRLKKLGFIYHSEYGLWELTPKSKNPTKYGIFLKKDTIRGHGYTWIVKLTKKPKDWNNRLEIIKQKNINYKLVGAKNTTPRIKALGRKVWLCNEHLRIFDTEKQSYYGDTAIESRKNSFLQLLRIIKVLENKLGFMFKPFEWEFRKEHYSLIKNDFAIEQNRKGVILRFSDEEGEWLLVDDSLGEGGELENVGKSAFRTNIPMQNWWNDHKKTKFKVTPTFLMENINEARENFKEVGEAIKESSKLQIDSELRLKQMQSSINGLTETVYQLIEVMKDKKQ